jgi:hypothetical protein
MVLPERDRLSLADAARRIAGRCDVTLEESQERLLIAFRDRELSACGYSARNLREFKRIASIDWRWRRSIGRAVKYVGLVTMAIRGTCRM